MMPDQQQQHRDQHRGQRLSLQEILELVRDYPETLAQLERCAQRHGIEADSFELIRAWVSYSDDRGASWSDLPDDESSLTGILVEHLRRLAGLRRGRVPVRAQDVLSIEDASQRLDQLSEEAAGGAEKILTVDGTPYVALISAEKYAYYRELELRDKR